MTPLELRLARRLGVTSVDYKPVAAIIGEMPGPAMHPKLPVFPLPARSAGGRLLAMSGIDPAAYLGAFWRRNLFVYARDWSRPEAQTAATRVIGEMRRQKITRAVLLGVKVGAAFGMGELWMRGWDGDIALAVIPHPSGRCRVYNDPTAKFLAGHILRWAAGLTDKIVP